MQPTNFFQLDVHRNNLDIHDSFVAQFGDFRTYRHVPVVDEGVITIRREPEYLLQHRIKRGPANEKAVLANAGLVLHLVHLAQRRGIQLKFRRMYGEDEAKLYRRAPHFDVANAKMLHLGLDYDPAWLALVLNEKRACIQLRSCVRESWLIAQLCLAWPQAKVLVLGTREPALQRLAEDLEEERVKRALPHIPVHRPPLVVPQSGITFSTWVDTKQIEFERGYDFVIVPDATQVEHQNARWPLSGIDARLGVFGFIRETTRLAPRTEAYVSAAFGPIGLDIPRHGMTKPRIQVAWLTINKGLLTTRGELRPNLFRDGIESHRYRNEKIIRLSQAERAPRLGGCDHGVEQQLGRLYVQAEPASAKARRNPDAPIRGLRSIRRRREGALTTQPLLWLGIVAQVHRVFEHIKR